MVPPSRLRLMSPADDFDAYLADLGSEEESPLELSDSEVGL